jgi:RNA polymerase sigma-70 factor (ECF subfamily)
MIEINEHETNISLDALRQSDRAEFAKLVEKYSSKIYRLALKILNSEEDAEDVLQETFIKALKALPKFEGRSSLATWLYRIAVNESLMIIRKKKPNMVSTDEEKETEDGQMEPIQIIDWCCMPESELMNSETQKLLSQAIQTLPSTLFSVFTLRDMQGASIKETADALELTETAVKTRLLRARLRLREKLSEYFSERAETRVSQ